MLQWMPVDLKEQMRRNSGLQIIDVREPEEFAQGRIPGAKNIPLGQLPDRYREIDPLRESVMVCRSGGRSSRACEFLSAVGYPRVHNLMGGMLGWDGDVRR